MSDVKRYDVMPAAMVDTLGEWVKWGDHADAVSALLLRLDAALEALTQIATAAERYETCPVGHPGALGARLTGVGRECVDIARAALGHDKALT